MNGRASQSILVIVLAVFAAVAGYAIGYDRGRVAGLVAAADGLEQGGVCPEGVSAIRGVVASHAR